MRIVLFFFYLIAVLTVTAQDSCSLKKFNEEHALYEVYNKASLYADAITHLASARNCALTLKLDSAYLNASIEQAELYRKTQDFQKGIDLLIGLNNTKPYPNLEARKLTRLSAIFYEHWPHEKKLQLDTMRSLLTKALDIALHFNYPLIEADIRNQLGVLLPAHDANLEKKIDHLEIAAKIFKKNEKFEDEVVVLNHLLNAYCWLPEKDKADSLRPIILEKIEGKEWHATKLDIYRCYSMHYNEIHDTLKYLDYKAYTYYEHMRLVKETHSNQMSAYRVINATAEAEEEARMNKALAKVRATELKEEQSKTRQLILVLTIISFVSFGFVFFMIRERKLKKSLNTTAENLNKANENYHMLLVESNHRIKNNLQMILSMLEFKALKSGKRTDELEKISGNIKAISTLHNHLALDVHNPQVDLIGYLTEIVSLYKEVSTQNFELKAKVETINIRSERVIYFGLMFNEMISNTIEHGLNDTTKVTVLLEQEEKRFSFMYKDGSSWDEVNNTGLGTALIPELVEHIDGTAYRMDSTQGIYYFEFED